LARILMRAKTSTKKFSLPIQRGVSGWEKIMCGTLQGQVTFRTEGHAGGGTPKDENGVFDGVSWGFTPGYLEVAPLGLRMLNKKAPANATGAKKAYVFAGFLKPAKT